MSGVEVITEDLKNHPSCPHGPTILFSRITDGIKRNFFACSACRDRKLCPFFLYQEELAKVSKNKLEAWEEERKKYLKGINHRKLFKVLSEVKLLPEDRRIYCHDCSRFEFHKFLERHQSHKISHSISDYQLQHPTELLEPLENVKKEAQFLFSQNAVQTIVEIFKELNYKKVICMGTPRLHEYITNECSDGFSSFLLDFDSRYHNFYGPLEFAWYNSFNHHFFFPEGEEIFNDFITLPEKDEELVLILDPPFGGRVEPLTQTITKIQQDFQEINKTRKKLSVFWIFPYFMEPQILNSLPNYKMLDYKVDYDNHALFQVGPKGRKQGSPVRIFTNVNPQEITLPESEGYKFCKICKIWVSIENRHCNICKSCTSKDGRTYVHCEKCEKCVKPTWVHCETCQRCAQSDHKCNSRIEFTQECFHCKKCGHKKRDCPEIDRKELHEKRKSQASGKKSKKRRLLNY